MNSYLTSVRNISALRIKKNSCKPELPSKILVLGKHLELKQALAVISTINFFISAGFFIENLQSKDETITIILLK
jgi:hypothetical protein